jgi:tetratricopeptide (TPR) repeat protein
LNTFGKAIELDQADPLPRMGLGLAKIREGKLKEGRREIEIAASLDPNQSLIRSYLGKAYYEEKRDKFAKGQFSIAEELDPLDPTPFFYDAIRKQSRNRPVEALHDLQKSIELNDNRAIYRSRLLLDDDLAARSASLARIYSDLGFQQLALVEGWKSLNIDPANYSAHRFLADSYSSLPRHEIARVSELLQSQLLQPINITPVQPQLAESSLFILSGAGPGDLSFNEFNPLFNRNRISLQLSGVAGENSTLGDELVVSGVHGKVSFSVGQFHYETDGFRENNDLEQDIYNVFVQASLSPKTSIQAEYRYKDTENGDLSLRFDPDNFFTTLRKKVSRESIRLGLRHTFSNRSYLVGSFVYGSEDFDTDVFAGFDLENDEDGYLAEVQHLYQAKRINIISGVGHFGSDQKNVVNFSPFPSMVEELDIRHSNLYLYSLFNYPKNVTWTIGASADFFESEILDDDQFNPKFGLTWDVFSHTTLRAAVFRVLKRTLISKQTLEPTQIAGFNQFFDDFRGTESWRYGIGIDQKFSANINGGTELSFRDLDVPLRDPGMGGQIRRADWEEGLIRAYLYWTPRPWLALNAEYQFERFERDPDLPGEEDIVEIETHRFPLGISFFHRFGFSARLKATYVDQDGKFGNSRSGVVQGDDQFWVVDASIGYRLPKRWGIITIEARNILDEEFKFQDTDPANPAIYPERLILARITLAY